MPPDRGQGGVQTGCHPFPHFRHRAAAAARGPVPLYAEAVKLLGLVGILAFMLGVTGTVAWEYLGGQPLATWPAARLTGGVSRFQVRLTPDMTPVRVMFSGGARRTGRVRQTGEYAVRVSRSGASILRATTRMRFRSSGSTTLRTAVRQTSSLGSFPVPVPGMYTVELQVPEQAGFQTTAAAVTLRRHASSPPVWALRAAFAAGAAGVLCLVLGSLQASRRRRRG